MAHFLASRPACAASAVSPSICTTAPPRRGFLFGDGGSSSIARACHHCRALVTPAARPGRRRVTIGNDRNSNSLTTIIPIPYPTPRFAWATPPVASRVRSCRGRFRKRNLKHAKECSIQQRRGFACGVCRWKRRFGCSRNSAVSAARFESGFRERDGQGQHWRGPHSHGGFLKMIVCESGGHANGLTYFIFRFLRRPLNGASPRERRTAQRMGRLAHSVADKARLIRFEVTCRAPLPGSARYGAFSSHRHEPGARATHPKGRP